jgi:hypothetical protein
MKVSMNGLRRNLARDFNGAFKTLTYADKWNDSLWSQLDESDKDKWHQLRQSIAFLLLVHDADYGDDFSELDPDEYLVLLPKEEDEEC